MNINQRLTEIERRAAAGPGVHRCPSCKFDLPFVDSRIIDGVERWVCWRCKNPVDVQGDVIAANFRIGGAIKAFMDIDDGETS